MTNLLILDISGDKIVARRIRSQYRTFTKFQNFCQNLLKILFTNLCWFYCISMCSVYSSIQCVAALPLICLLFTSILLILTSNRICVLCCLVFYYSQVRFFLTAQTVCEKVDLFASNSLCLSWKNNTNYYEYIILCGKLNYLKKWETRFDQNYIFRVDAGQK